MRVRVEHLEQPVGIGDRRPRLSWQLPEGAGEQFAYELRLDDGTSTGRVDSPQNVLVPWPGGTLSARERRRVQVRVWTDRGESPWSEPTALEAGLLEPANWVSSWVTPAEPAGHRPGFRPAYLLRGEAHVDRRATAARLYVTAHGIYEIYLNGRRVGDLELAPGFTTENGIATADDRRRIQYTEAALDGLAAAMADGIDVRGYLHWSLLDNFEWAEGYGPTFGLVAVDRETFVRTPKPSLAWLGSVARQSAEQVRT